MANACGYHMLCWLLLCVYILYCALARWCVCLLTLSLQWLAAGLRGVWLLQLVPVPSRTNCIQMTWPETVPLCLT